MEHTTFSVSTPILQCPHCGWPVEERPDPPVIGGVPAIIRLNTIPKIAAQVAYRRGDVTAEEIMRSRDRSRRVTRARHETMWIARDLRNPDGTHRFSLPNIGRQFRLGERGMDHSSVLNAVRRHAEVIRAEVIASVQADNAASVLRHRVTW